jgi:hypothetical protein
VPSIESDVGTVGAAREPDIGSTFSVRQPPPTNPEEAKAAVSLTDARPRQRWITPFPSRSPLYRPDRLTDASTLSFPQWVHPCGLVKTTGYFANVVLRKRPHHRLAWCERMLANLIRHEVQPDGRMRCWGAISQLDGRVNHVVRLSDGDTVHNAVPDQAPTPRRSRPESCWTWTPTASRSAPPPSTPRGRSTSRHWRPRGWRSFDQAWPEVGADSQGPEALPGTAFRGCQTPGWGARFR